jgi:ubiquinone/menaquinone biosynthesis C-methylase UbiE
LSSVIKPEIDWSAYATQYDLMCHHNNSYEENISELLKYVEKLGLDSNCRIADIGAGTGNYICELSNILPDARFTHLDSNREMNLIAVDKYDSLGVKNICVIEEEIQRVEFEPGQFDLVICVNALYAMNPQEIILAKIRDWIAPTGILYVIDLGRKMDSVDWGYHFLKKATKERRLLAYLNDTFIHGREVLKQNRLTTAAQASGRYWTHETKKFGEILINSGFEIERLEPCYRGYSDLAICRKPPV